MSVLAKLRERNLNSKLATIKVILPSGIVRLYAENKLDELNKALETLDVTLYKMQDSESHVIETNKVDDFTSEDLKNLKQELPKDVRITISAKASSEEVSHIEYNAQLENNKKFKKSVATSLDDL